MTHSQYEIIAFYEFKKLRNLEQVKNSLRSAMAEDSIYGTFIIAEEGFNSTLCGDPDDIKIFIPKIEAILKTKINYKSSFYDEAAFQRQKVKIKIEIVTLRKPVDIKTGIGTHVKSIDWNRILNDPDVLILDTRNDYEYKVGTFRGAINPKTRSFNELPEFVEKNLNPDEHKKIAMFCTGGIRCEKFTPYLKGEGFEEIYQLEGGILEYLEKIPKEESLWEGECFVFDERITVDEQLRKGEARDLSINKKREV